MTKNGHQKFLT